MFRQYLVEECTENIDETKLVNITVENENESRCTSYLVYKVLFFIFFITSCEIIICFVCHKYVKNDAWYLVTSDKDDVYKKLVDIFESIKNEITEKTWDVVEYDNDYMEIKFESNNIFPTDKDVNIRIATIIIRAILTKNGKYYPQLFLDDGLYKNVSI